MNENCPCFCVVGVMCFTSQTVSIPSFCCRLGCLIDFCHLGCSGAVSDNFLKALVEVEHLGFRNQVEIITLFLGKKKKICVVET